MNPLIDRPARLKIGQFSIGNDVFVRTRHYQVTMEISIGHTRHGCDIPAQQTKRLDKFSWCHHRAGIDRIVEARAKP